MSAILKSYNISIDIKIRFLRCCMFSTLLYGTETWILTKSASNKLDAFEL